MFVNLAQGWQGVLGRRGGGLLDVSGGVELARSSAGAAYSLRAGVIDRPSISRGLYGACVRSFLDVSGSKPGGSRSWGPDSRKSNSSMRPVGSCSSMPSITGGLNGAPAGRFLDVSGGVGVLFPPPRGL